MNCETILLMLHAMVDGQLTPAEHAVVDEHLDECARCREELAELRGLDAVLNRALQPPAPEPVVQRVMQAIDRKLLNGDSIRHAEVESQDVHGSWAQHVEHRSARAGARKSTAGTMFLLIGTLAIALVMVLQLPKEAPAVAEITMATGSIDVRRPNSATWTTLEGRSAVPLPPDAQVRTRGDSLCEIRTKSDAVVRLNHQTELVMRRPEQIELVSGELWCRAPSRKALEISTAKTSSAKRSEATFICPTSSELQWHTAPDNLVSCTGVSTSSIEVAVQPSHETCTVSPGETVSFGAGNAPARIGYEDRMHALVWQLPLLILRSPRDPELRQRLTDLLAAAGHSKMAFLYEEQIRQLGAPGTLPLIAFVRSAESRDQSELRQRAMRIIADLAPQSSVADLDALLKDDDPSVRQLASHALQRLRSSPKDGRP